MCAADHTQNKNILAMKNMKDRNVKIIATKIKPFMIAALLTIIFSSDMTILSVNHF